MDAGRVKEYLVAAGHNVAGVALVTADPTTWQLVMGAGATAAETTAAVTAMRAYDEAAAVVVDAHRLSQAARESARFDVLATCALVAKYTNEVAWAAMTPAQKIARVRALANDWKGFRVFVEAQA